MHVSNTVIPRLIILSDLWGSAKPDWLSLYTDALKLVFNIEFYDSCQLAEVDTSDLTEENLHRQFIDGGIERAVQNLLALEKSEVHILAFSIGGTIAWKYGLHSGLIQSLTCVSSTRLRYETQKPSGCIKVYFGEEDTYRPADQWLQSMTDEFTILPKKTHTLYQEQTFSSMLCNQFLKSLK